MSTPLSARENRYLPARDTYLSGKPSDFPYSLLKIFLRTALRLGLNLGGV